jgi:hypothetical protein
MRLQGAQPAPPAGACFMVAGAVPAPVPALACMVLPPLPPAGAGRPPLPGAAPPGD